MKREGSATGANGRRYEIGRRLATRLAAVDPRLAAQGQLVASLGSPFDNYPSFVARAEGPYLWDVDGNRYIDFLLGYGPVILGHNEQSVIKAAREQLERGVCQAPMWTPVQLELVEKLCEVIPNAEMAFVLKTGSDATSCAVRLARIHTGRPMIVRWGYNGWHDWSCPRPAGIPPEVRALSKEFEYNSIESVDRLFSAHGEQIACVIMMPYEFELPETDFLQHVRDIAHRHGALFIFDEVRSGFRLALGGAQEYFGVDCDLACFSKAMGNGFAVSAVTGSRFLMERMAHTKISSTFFANPIDQAAAVATIRQLETLRPFDEIARMGSMLLEGMASIFSSYSLGSKIVGHPATPFFALPDELPRDAERLFFEGCAGRGVLLHPNHQWFISAAHSDSDIAYALTCIEESLDHCLRSTKAVR